MRKSIFILFLILSMSLTAQSTWKADKAHSNINFAISHLVISEVTGNFGQFEIDAAADDAFNEPTFTVSIETASINTGNSRRDDHLKSDDFFGAEANPTISFKSISFEKTGEKTFILKGDLTMRGTTKSVELTGKLNGIITDQRSNKLKAGLKLTGTVNRKDFGVGTKPFPVGDEVEITINLEMAQE